MAIKVKVRNNRQIIVPLRFGRAVTGDPVANAPDVDDRGFAMGVRPGTWGSTTARGAMVSMTAGDTIRLKVRREDIDGMAKLFVTSSDTSLVTVTDPQNGELAVDGNFSIKGLVDVISKPVKIQVHFGSATGPVLAEMEPHIFQLRQLRVRAHMVTINGTGPSRDPDSLGDFFDAVNVTWRPVGIEFLYNAGEIVYDNIPLSVAGQVTTHLSANPPDFAEFSKVLQLTPDRNAINVYFVPATNDTWVGLTFDNDVARPDGFGCVVVDNGNVQALAHELGHYLDLDLHSNENGARQTIRDDIWTERHLLYYSIGLDTVFSRPGHPNQTQPAYRHDVGYGDLVPGALIDVKDFSGDAANTQQTVSSDGCVARTRRRSLHPF